MKGKLIKVDDKWYVEYTGVSYKGGNPKQLGNYTKKVEKKTLPLLMDSTTFPKNRSNFVIGSRVKFTEVLVNPMGREVDPNDLGQNHSSCVWYAKIVEGKEEQKQHLIDMMKSDEELGLYEQIDQNNPVTKGSTALVKEIKLEDIFNDEKREGVKRVIHQHKVLKGLSLVNPAHLEMTSNGHGEFPDGYKLTEKGIQYIIEQLNKE
jgi:hypothetical protein